MESALFLCESCGYDIRDLPAPGHCPECGRSIASSHPANRVGSPWQVRRSVHSWALTNFLMLRRPGCVYGRLRVDDKAYLSLLVANLVLAGVMLALPWVGTLIGDPARNSGTSSDITRALAYSRSAITGTAGIAMVLFLLTSVETLGIRFFGRRKGWRITTNIAWQVCAHASIGWVVAAILTLFALVIWLNLSHFGYSAVLSHSGRTGDYLMASVPLVGFLAGMLVFETLVYLGMRRCRFANAPRATDVQAAEHT